MTTARDLMTTNTTCAHTDDTLADAAAAMRRHDVGALPVCGDDDRLHGMVTDRDIVVKCVADGGDPRVMRVSSLCDGTLVTVGVDASVDEVVRTMTEHRVRRLPVLDGERLVGVVCQADVAAHLPPEKVGRLVRAITASAPND